MLTGTVIWYNPVKGLGFINPDQGGDDVFVHMSALKASGLKVVKEGDMLTYELLLDEKTGKKAASNVTILKKDEASLLTSSSSKPKNRDEKKKQRVEQPKSDASAFSKLGLDAEIVKALGFLGYTLPTPIQSQAIPAVLNSKDLVGLAQTGTGKTAAFALPLIQQLLMNPIAIKGRSARAIILSPTRELALQIHEAFVSFGKRLPLNFTHAIGGAPIRKQMRDRSFLTLPSYPSLALAFETAVEGGGGFIFTYLPTDPQVRSRPRKGRLDNRKKPSANAIHLEKEVRWGWEFSCG